MDLMQIRRMLLSMVGGGNVSNCITGNFTPSEDVNNQKIDLGVPTTRVKSFVVYADTNDITGTNKELIAQCVVEPQFAMADYGSVTPYYHTHLFVNSAGNLQPNVSTRSTQSSGPATSTDGTGYENRWIIRCPTAAIMFKQGTKYVWKAYLE